VEGLEKIISPFVLERKRNFDNKSVVGGFSKFVLSNLTNLEVYNVDTNKIKKLIERYEHENEENRKKYIMIF